MRSSVLRNLSIGALLLVICSSESLAYSVLSHEAIIDAAWKDSIVPALQKRFPHATPQELLHAQAYAYGGAIIQDLGYYPFGNQFFTDLTHYVRSGDFVLALLEESRDLNEYAFALGALSHYVADTSGHQLATNRAVAIMIPSWPKSMAQLFPTRTNHLHTSRWSLVLMWTRSLRETMRPRRITTSLASRFQSRSLKRRSRRPTRSICLLYLAG